MKRDKLIAAMLVVIMALTITCTQAFAANTSSEYDAIIDAMNDACYTSGAPGSAESTGIIGATTGGNFVNKAERLSDNIKWTLSDKVLTLSGTGNTMDGRTDYVDGKIVYVTPFAHNEHIETVIIGENVELLGNRLISALPNLKTVIFMNANTYVGVAHDNPNLETVIIGANMADNPLAKATAHETFARNTFIDSTNRLNANVDNTVKVIVLNSEYNDWDKAVADAKNAVADLPESVTSKLPAELGGAGEASKNETERINAFKNIKVSAWAEDIVWNAMELGIVEPNEYLGSYHYTNAITRAEFCKLATRVYETVKGSAITGYTDIFTDTDDINVLKMAKLGIVGGYGGGVFGPDDTLTREQAAVILARMAEVIEGKTLTEAKTPFTDTNTDWAASGIAKTYGMGVMNGTSNTTFSPKSSYTIEQSIVTMQRLYEYVTK